MKKQFEDVNAKYGAPMGRSDVTDNPEATVHVFRVRMVDGDYDDGGAYWGGGFDSEPLFCARSDDGDFEAFMRASDMKDARERFLDDHPGITIVDEFDIESMIAAYLECALWSSTDFETDTPFDAEHCVDDFHRDAEIEAETDCWSFLNMCREADLDIDSIDASQVGHDFWLTRNHHGAGFWDRGLGELGDKLTEIAHTFGSVDPWVDRNNKVRLD